MSFSIEGSRRWTAINVLSAFALAATSLTGCAPVEGARGRLEVKPNMYSDAYRSVDPTPNAAMATVIAGTPVPLDRTPLPLIDTKGLSGEAKKLSTDSAFLRTVEAARATGLTIIIEKGQFRVPNDAIISSGLGVDKSIGFVINPELIAFLRVTVYGPMLGREGVNNIHRQALVVNPSSLGIRDIPGSVFVIGTDTGWSREYDQKDLDPQQGITPKEVFRS